MQCSSCGKTLVPSTTVCPMCKTPVPNRGSAQADDEYTEYADVLHQPIPFVETQKSFFNVQPSSPAQETTLSEHQDRQLVPPHHLQSEKRAMRYNSTELVVAIALLLLGLTFLGGALFFSKGFGGHLDKVIIGVVELITSAIAFGGIAKAHLLVLKTREKRRIGKAILQRFNPSIAAKTI